MLSTLTNGELSAILQAHGGGTEPGKKGTLHLSKQSLLAMLSVRNCAPSLLLRRNALPCTGVLIYSCCWAGMGPSYRCSRTYCVSHLKSKFQAECMLHSNAIGA